MWLSPQSLITFATRKTTTGRAAPLPPQPQQHEAWVDIDANNADNPLACSEYAVLIFEHLKESEVRAWCCFVV